MVPLIGIFIMLWGILNIHRAVKGNYHPMKIADTKFLFILFMLGFIVFPLLIGFLLIFGY